MAHVIRLGGGSVVSRGELEQYLAGLPGVERDVGAYLYSDGDLDLEAELRPLGTDGKAEGLEVSVSDPLAPRAAEVLAALCAGLADRFDWRMRDADGQQDLSQSAVRARFIGGPLAAARPGGCLPGLAALAALALRARMG